MGIPTSITSIKNEISVVEDTITLPTSDIGFDNPNTQFIQTAGYPPACSYPYTFHTHFLRDKLIDKEYRRITFENEYLIVEFLPELGGRVWRLYDKVHDAEAIHRNDCVKPYPGGFGGAYTAGGIELNYPYAHSVTNMWPRKTEYRENPDGSATYIVSEWERVGRTLWAMSFTLSPGESRLKQRVEVYNRSKLPLSFCYWGNAGVPVDQDARWMFREAMGSEHGGANAFTWPEYKGLDLSWYKNDLEIIGIYFLEPRYNFFGMVNGKKKLGLAHYASRHDLPGKKLWTWGCTPSGENRMWHLALDPTRYGEIQSGRLMIQEHMEWLMPEEYLSWDEQWAPIHGLSDMSEVTEDCAFQLLADERKIIFYPFADVRSQQLRFYVDGKILRETSFSASTSEMGEIDMSFLSQEEISRLNVHVVKGEKDAGVISLLPRCKKKSPNEMIHEPVFDEHSSMAYFINAEFNHKLLYRKKAMHYYQKAIDLDSYNYKAYTGLGRMLFAHGELEASREKLKKAIDCYKWDTEAYLMLSHIDHLQGRIDEAVENAYCARYYGDKCRANIKLGELSIVRGEYLSALRFLDEAVLNNAMSLRSQALRAICERKLGNRERALKRLQDAPESLLKDLLWYSELWMLGYITESDLQRELFYDEWRFLELTLNYIELGLFEEAGRIADLGIGINSDGWELEKIYNPGRLWSISRKRETPFLHMLKGYIAAKVGCEEEAGEHFSRGDYFEYFVNANQPEFEGVLKLAIEHGNIFANHYFGNYLYHNFREEEAAKCWGAVEAQHAGCSVNTRNLAIYARDAEKDNEKARSLLRKALEMNPQDLFLRQELIVTERACGASSEQILDIYLDASEEQKQAYLLTRGLLAAYQQAGKWEEAAEYLRTVDRRHVDEGATWYEFCLNYADFLIEEGNPEEALQWIARSRPNPENLTYVNYSDDYFYFHRQYYLTGLAHKMLGDSTTAAEYFQKTIQQPADFYFFKTHESTKYALRFYMALALNELGMNALACSLLGGINKYRETQALIPLKPEKSEIKRWGEKDRESLVVVQKHTGPEI